MWVLGVVLRTEYVHLSPWFTPFNKTPPSLEAGRGKEGQVLFRVGWWPWPVSSAYLASTHLSVVYFRRVWLRSTSAAAKCAASFYFLIRGKNIYTIDPEDHGSNHELKRISLSSEL